MGRGQPVRVRSVRMLRCPSCGFVARFEALECVRCGTALAYHLPTLAMGLAVPGGTVIAGQRWRTCANRGTWRCTWLVAEETGGAECVACRLVRRRPDPEDVLAVGTLAQTAQAERRLVVQLVELGLPTVPHHERAGGLGFDLLSARPAGEPVVIGHANGIITIDLTESLDAHREMLRATLGEPYRTMLGHFRHEIGHYYQGILVDGGPFQAECRALFGDETASYAEALERHYALGAPTGWVASYISEYATMHPWEDFAETFAHYLHITDTLGTASAAGLVLRAEHLEGLLDHDVVPRASYADATMSEILDDWNWLSLMLNRVNRAMGKEDLYPFAIVGAVARKLDLVHRLVQASRVRPG